MDKNCDTCRYSLRAVTADPCATCNTITGLHWEPRRLNDATPEEWSASTPTPRAKPAGDPVNHPTHYTRGTIECIEYMQDVLTPEEYRGYLRGQVIKYQHRLTAKGNPAQDAAKLAWYANRLANLKL